MCHILEALMLHLQWCSLALSVLWKKVEQEAVTLNVSVRPLGAQRDSLVTSSRNRLQSCDIRTATRVLPFELTPSSDHVPPLAPLSTPSLPPDELNSQVV